MATYKVGANGKAPDYAKEGDIIVTGGGSYIIQDGKGKLVDKDTTTYNYQGAYSQNPTDPMNVPGYGNGTSFTQIQAVPQLDISAYYSDLMKGNEDKLASMKQAQIQSANRTYDNLAQQAYIQKQQNDANMGTVLALSGQTGGLAETTALSPQVQYGNALNEIGRNRAETLNQINMASDQQALNLAIDYADKLIAQMNNDRSFAYNVYSDNWNRNYQTERDKLADTRYEDELAYSRNNDAYNNALNIANATGDYSPMKSFGWTDAQVNAMRNQYYSASRSGGSRSSGSRSSGSRSSGSSKMSYAQMVQAVENAEDPVAMVLELDNLQTLSKGDYNSLMGVANKISESATRLGDFGNSVLSLARNLLSNTGDMISVVDLVDSYDTNRLSDDQKITILETLGIPTK